MLSTVYKNNPTLSIVLSQQNMQKSALLASIHFQFALPAKLCVQAQEICHPQALQIKLVDGTVMLPAVARLFVKGQKEFIQVKSLIVEEKTWDRAKRSSLAASDAERRSHPRFCARVVAPWYHRGKERTARGLVYILPARATNAGHYAEQRHPAP